MGTFKKSKKLKLYAESLVIGRSSLNDSRTDAMKRYTVHPPLFIAYGLPLAAKGIAIWIVGLVALYFLLVGLPEAVYGPTGIGLPNQSILYDAILFLPLAWAVFAVPSTYSDFGAREADVSTLVTFLSSLRVTEKAETEGMRDIVDDLESRAERRVKVLRQGPVFVWAVVVFLFQQYLRTALVTPQVILDTMGYMNFVVGALLVTGVWFLVVESYAASVNRMFKTMKFALIELLVKIESTSDGT